MMAICISLYQDYDVSHVKPQGVLREQALYGLAYGESEDKIHPAYNTVLQHHREWRVPMWKQAASNNGGSMSQKDATQNILEALSSIQQLKIMAADYQWEEMQAVIRQPALTSQLEEACAVLRKTAGTPEARDEIGFDWGRYVRVCVRFRVHFHYDP